MERERVIAILREHQVELKAGGVEHLSLFGSVARGDAGARSDIDILAELDRTKYRSLFALGGLHTRLSEWLDNDVDLAIADRLRPPFRENILKETIVVF